MEKEKEKEKQINNFINPKVIEDLQDVNDLLIMIGNLCEKVEKYHVEIKYSDGVVSIPIDQIINKIIKSLTSK